VISEAKSRERNVGGLVLGNRATGPSGIFPAHQSSIAASPSRLSAEIGKISSKIPFGGEMLDQRQQLFARPKRRSC